MATKTRIPRRQMSSIPPLLTEQMLITFGRQECDGSDTVSVMDVIPTVILGLDGI